MQLTSYGAADGVTGSCHLLEVGDYQLMLDCGIFQGRGNGERNEPPLPFDVSKVDAILVSHAHLDHIGRLPLLVKEGFQGRVISNRPTYDLARISLLDSARILDSDAERKNRKRRKNNQPEIEPLYDESDVLDLLDMWKEFIPYQKRTEIAPHIHATFFDAGHILGSSFIYLELQEGDRTVRFVFSGDLGNIDKPIINDPEMPPEADVVLMESTYGNRSHRPFAQTIAELEAAVTDIINGGGNVMIPSFALERSQELLYVLYEAWREGRIPKDIHIYLDSPMAIDATKIFTKHPDCFDQDALDLAAEGGNPFHFPALTYTRHTVDSKRINDHPRGAIIIAGSGMCTGGRILHHLRHNLHRANCGVIFCGYQGRGTLGRRIIDGDDTVRIHGRECEVHAKVHTINGFSGHAGQDTLTRWADTTRAKTIILVHGEQDVREAFAEHLKKTTTTQHIINQTFATPIEL